MTTRDISYMHLNLQRAWAWLKAEYARMYPGPLQPELSETYRSYEDQLKAYKAGKSKARPGESLHNYSPTGAFDIYFLDARTNKANWEFIYYQRFGELAESIGLVWGGRWAGLVDGPHIQLPMTWQDAKAGKYPDLPLLPRPRAELQVVVITGLAESEIVFRKPFVVSIDGTPLESGKRLDIRFK